MLVLTDDDVKRLLTPRRALGAMSRAFGDARNPTLPVSDKLDAYASSGEFHVKTGASGEGFAVKANSGFFGAGGGGIRGVVLLFDLRDGAPLAVLHSGALTAIRTAACTALALRTLAPHGADVLALVGGGRQAVSTLYAVADAMTLNEVHVWASDRRLPELDAAADEVGVPLVRARTPRDAVRGVPLVVTCTPARSPLLERSDIARGATIAAVGADSPGKQELSNDLVRAAAVVTDLTHQCRTNGELQHAPDAQPRAEFADVLSGAVSGRESEDEIIVYDSTGAGFQDAAAAQEVVALSQCR